MSDWNKTEVITVPKGFYGWRTKGCLRYEDKVFRFPVGQATSLPAPVVEHLRKLIELPEEERPEQPHKYSANSTFTTDADGNPVWSPVDVTALSDELKGNGPHQMLVTDVDGNVSWEEKPFYQEVVTKEDSVVAIAGGVNAFYDDGYGYLLNRRVYVHEGAWFTFRVGDDSVSCAATDIPANNYTNVAVGGINIEVQSRNTPKAGLLCLRLLTTPGSEVYISYNYPVVHQIEEIFVPDTIARTSDIPTDDHINSLIDAKLGVIENGTY